MTETLKLPERLTLELTNRCNLSCEMCPRHYMRYPQGFMAPALFERVVDEMSALGIPTLVPFFRGESLLHPDFSALMAYAKTKGLAIQLATNGSLLSRALAEELVDIELDFVSFSLDTLDLQAYRDQRHGELAQALKGLDNLLTARGARELPLIQVSAVDTGLSEDSKAEFVAHFQARVERVRIYPQHTIGGHFGSLGQAQSAERRPCLKPFREMVVYWDGQVAACNHDWDRRQTLGDLNAQSIAEVWQDQAYRKLRSQHESGMLDDTCGACDHWRQFYEGPVGEVYENQKKQARDSQTEAKLDARTE